MDLIDRLTELNLRIMKQIEYIQTEEATKNSLVMPFLNALGYDVFNPLEVIPEFTADVGIKKGEKVDYAIKKDGEIILLIECKQANTDLSDTHSSQLYRYFSTTKAKFGILTNGVQYKFFSDIEEPNKMDKRPFFEFNLSSFSEHEIEEIKKFSKSNFNLEEILSTASNLKYNRSVKQIFAEEINKPSPGFVRFFASKVYSGQLRQSVVEDFTKIVKDALNQFIRERINDKFKSVLESEPDEELQVNNEMPDNDNGIVTTELENEGFYIIRSIGREIVDVNRIHMRDTKSYCGILLDNNNRKPICRLRFDLAKKYIGIFEKKVETKKPIEVVEDIYKFGDEIKKTIQEYLEEE